MTQRIQTEPFGDGPFPPGPDDDDGEEQSSRTGPGPYDDDPPQEPKLSL
ncbi:MAG TPA: hypothetical protein VK140_07490 [Ktedonobacteraceae bacterium]|nr:hypothetical protein [Ktedonobacteraceae bacterium]